MLLNAAHFPLSLHFPFAMPYLKTNSFIFIYYMICYEQFIISYQLCDHSKYYDDNSFSDVLKHSNNRLTMISLNCQSISAKFDRLKLFVTEMNTHETISVICILETWKHNGIDMDAFSLPNYTLVNENRRISNHGGLIIYVHDIFSFKVLNKDIHITHSSKLFEILIVDMWRNNSKYQKYIIGSIYRLPS